MKIGYIFPGQGSQVIGMGKDIYEQYEEVREVYSNVENITGISIAKISFEGPQEVLNETQNTQLAILTMSLGILEILKKNNIVPNLSAGLSLGEYTALINSNAISFEDGVRLVQKRGECMQNFLPKGNWKMAAIIGLEDDKVEEICKEVSCGFVVPANYNTRGQVVISGEEEAIFKASQLANNSGAKKVMVLNTSGPFHTKMLEDASNEFRKELNKAEFNKFGIDVIRNIDGQIYEDTDDMRDILSKHIVSPVRFSKTLDTMMKNGIDTFIEIGPGKTLSGFVKRMKVDRKINIYSINDSISLKQTMENIKNMKGEDDE